MNKGTGRPAEEALHRGGAAQDERTAPGVSHIRRRRDTAASKPDRSPTHITAVVSAALGFSSGSAQKIRGATAVLRLGPREPAENTSKRRPNIDTDCILGRTVLARVSLQFFSRFNRRRYKRSVQPTPQGVDAIFHCCKILHDVTPATAARGKVRTPGFTPRITQRSARSRGNLYNS